MASGFFHFIERDRKREREREREREFGLATESTRIKLKLKFNAEIKGTASPAIYDMNFKRILGGLRNFQTGCCQVTGR